MNYKQGDIIKVALGPTIGHEQKGYRPVLVIQNNLLSEAIESTTVVLPISTSNTLLPFEIELPKSLKTKGKILCRQVRALDLKSRDTKYVETVSNEILDQAIFYVSKIISK